LSINWSLADLKGFMKLTPSNSNPSCKSSVTKCRTPTRRAAAHIIASQNASLWIFTASSADERSFSTATRTGKTARRASIIVRTSWAGIRALRIATFAEFREGLQQQHARPAPYSSRVRRYARDHLARLHQTPAP